jgi:putative peptidoglycan lipid II flippase
MKNILKRLNKSRSLSIAAFIISLSYLLSRILGLVRDRLLASNFGVSAATDAYTAAFRIPDLLFTLLVSGAFAVAFIPVFIDYFEKGKKDTAWQLANSLLNILCVGTLLFGALAFVFAGPMVKALAPGFDQQRFDMTVHITRIMLITPFFFALASVFGAIQQAFNRFLLFAMASVFYNLGIIVGIVVFAKLFANDPIYGVAWGVVLGTFMQAAVQILGTTGLGFKYGFILSFKLPGVWKVIKLMIPRSLDLTIDQINWIIQTAIASRLSVGSLAAYYYANNLKNVPVALFGAAISTAAFPSLIRAVKNKHGRMPAEFTRDMGLILFLVIPSAAIAFVMRGYIVRLLFGFGDQTTANTLGWLAGTIVAQSVFYMVARAFYALEDTKTPLYTSLSSILINIVLSFTLSAKFGVEGMAMALSVSTLYEAILLMYLLRRKAGSYGGRDLLIRTTKITIATAVSSVVMYFLVTKVFPLYKASVGFLSLAPQFAIIAGSGIIIFFGLSLLLRGPQATSLS